VGFTTSFDNRGIMDKGIMACFKKIFEEMFFTKLKCLRYYSKNFLFLAFINITDNVCATAMEEYLHVLETVSSEE
jgi:hypothetical protein